MAQINYAKQMDLGGGRVMDANGLIYTDERDEYGVVAPPVRASDAQLQMFNNYFASPEYINGKAKAAEQAAADNDWAPFNSTTKMLLPLMVMGGAAAAGAFGGAGAALPAAVGDSAALGMTGADVLAGGAGAAGSTGGSWLDQLMRSFTSSSGGDASWGVNPQSGGSLDFGDIGNFSNDIVDGSGNLNTTLGNGSFGINGGSSLGFPSWLQNLPSGSGSLLQSILGNSGGLAGAALGALLGGVGANQKPAGSITTTQDIPDYLKPYQSMNLTSGMQNFGLASSGQSLLPSATNYMQDTISGKFLDPNQNPAFKPYISDLMGQAGSQFAARYGATPEALNNSGNQEGFTRAITAATLPAYMQAFQTAQGNQYNAATNAPGFAGNVAGAALAPNLAFKNLYTGPQSNTTPYFSNTMGGALSGALAGGTLGSQLGRG